MTIQITLGPELEARLQQKAKEQGQDINWVASELLKTMLAWEVEETEAAIQGIQRGLDDFDAGNFRSFESFIDDQKLKYILSGLT